MDLRIWSPFFDLEKDLRSMRERLPSILGEQPEWVFRPTTDMKREDGNIIVTTELPGIDPENDVEITVENDVLVIRGEKSEERETQDEDRFLHERHYGTFERRLPLPEGVDPDSIDASYEKGVLTVTVPMPEITVEKKRSIPIKTG